jgi:short-subunit dehydrogenase
MHGFPDNLRIYAALAPLLAGAGRRVVAFDCLGYLASVVAFQPFPHFALYAASKAFVLSFTQALAEEIKGTGVRVRVLALCPGAVRTELDVFAHNEGLLGKLPSLTPEQVVSVALRALAVGRVTHVVGWFNRMLVFANRLLPRRAIRGLTGVAAKPPHTHQPKPTRAGSRSNW